MIASLKGTIRVCEPTRVVLETCGIGFELLVPLSTSLALKSLSPDSVVLVQPVFGRNGVTLYGFATPDERDIFNQLIAVPGVGPRAALNLLSRFAPTEIRDIIARQEIEILKTVPGIGPKKATQILERLHQAAQPEVPMLPVLKDAVSALVSLGLTQREAWSRLEQIKDRHTLNLNELLRSALKTKG